MHAAHSPTSGICVNHADHILISEPTASLWPGCHNPGFQQLSSREVLNPWPPKGEYHCWLVWHVGMARELALSSLPGWNRAHRHLYVPKLPGYGLLRSGAPEGGLGKVQAWLPSSRGRGHDRPSVE